MATIERTQGAACRDRECHKQHRRDATTIFILRRELEATREALEEAEREIERLERAG